jgi:hypothetical protein
MGVNLIKNLLKTGPSLRPGHRLHSKLRYAQAGDGNLRCAQVFFATDYTDEHRYLQLLFSKLIAVIHLSLIQGAPPSAALVCHR